MLIDAGFRPIILDGGATADDQAMQAQRAARSYSGSQHEQEVQEDTSGSPGQKSWFGSSSAYEQAGLSPLRYQPGLLARASYGVGGFSRVWGGTFAFKRDWREWPTGAIPSDGDIDSVRQLVPASETTWDETLLGTSGYVLGSPTSRLLMDRFTAARSETAWNVEPSVVAINSQVGSAERCQSDGGCLRGCPFNSIWCASDQVQRWQLAGLIDYRPGTIARRIREGADVTVHAQGTDGQWLEVQCRRAYIAAGPISTAAILIQSGAMQAVTIRDTSTAFSAAVRIGLPRRALPTTRHHDLSQWWVMPDGDREFAAQVYAPSLEHAGKLMAKLPFGRRFRGSAEFGAQQLHPVISYLDSELSDPLIVRDAGSTVEVIGATSPQTKARFKVHLNRLAKQMRKAGWWMPSLATEFTPPGTGVHLGASLAHGDITDDLGRLPDWNRVHIVDSSVLPRIEVGSITPTIMANAVRIARASATLSAD